MKNTKFDYLMRAALAVAIVAAVYYAVASEHIPFIDKFFGAETTQQAAVEQNASPVTVQQKPEKVLSDEMLKEVAEEAEKRLDPRAIEEVKRETVKKEIEEAREQQDTPQAKMPLTDVAPPPPVMDVSAAEHPAERLRQMKLGETPQEKYKQRAKLPTNMNLEHPPEWTETLAAPAIPTQSPDPFTKPPIKVNPKRLPEQP